MDVDTWGISLYTLIVLTVQEAVTAQLESHRNIPPHHPEATSPGEAYR